ncbi:MAG: hypothetical protein AAFY08_06370 [Planctomycetota bacterium]
MTFNPGPIAVGPVNWGVLKTASSPGLVVELASPPRTTAANGYMAGLLVGSTDTGSSGFTTALMSGVPPPEKTMSLPTGTALTTIAASEVLEAQAIVAKTMICKAELLFRIISYLHDTEYDTAFLDFATWVKLNSG